MNTNTQSAKPGNGNAVVPVSGKEVEAITRDKITAYLQTFGLVAQLQKNEVDQFVEIATAYQLNPFKREIYCIPYGKGEDRKLSIVTGYEVYLKRAERLNVLDGWRTWTEGTLERRKEKKTINYKDKQTGQAKSFEKDVDIWRGDLRACIEITRKDWSKPFYHEVYFEEYTQDNQMWNTKPRTMIKKVVVAQGFRLAFPDEMGGMPYSSDELPDEMVHQAEYIPPQTTVETTPAKAPEQPETQPAPVISDDAHVLAPGEEVGKWFWKLSSEQRKKFIPEGCKYEKIGGKWICNRSQ